MPKLKNTLDWHTGMRLVCTRTFEPPPHTDSNQSTGACSSHDNAAESNCRESRSRGFRNGSHTCRWSGTPTGQQVTTSSNARTDIVGEELIAARRLATGIISVEAKLGRRRTWTRHEIRRGCIKRNTRTCRNPETTSNFEKWIQIKTHVFDAS